MNLLNQRHFRGFGAVERSDGTLGRDETMRRVFGLTSVAATTARWRGARGCGRELRDHGLEIAERLLRLGDAPAGLLLVDVLFVERDRLPERRDVAVDVVETAVRLRDREDGAGPLRPPISLLEGLNRRRKLLGVVRLGAEIEEGLGPGDLVPVGAAGAAAGAAGAAVAPKVWQRQWSPEGLPVRRRAGGRALRRRRSQQTEHASVTSARGSDRRTSRRNLDRKPITIEPRTPVARLPGPLQA